MKQILTVLFCALSLTMVACGDHPYVDPVYSRAIAEEWYQEQAFLTIEAVERIEGTETGRVIIQREEDWNNDGEGDKFSAIVSPYKNIPIGTKVELVHVRYNHNAQFLGEFWLVKVK